MERDVQLRILAVYYVIVGLLTGLSIIYAFTEGFPPPPPGQPTLDPETMRLMFMVMMTILALAYFYVAYAIHRRIHRIYCIVMGALNALNFPIGTIFGLWTVYALTRPEMRTHFSP